MSLSVDENRIIVALERWAKMYDEAYAANPFSFHRVRAKAIRKCAAAIRMGKHR